MKKIMDLRGSIRNTLNHLDGWTTGRTLVEDGKAFLQLDNGDDMQLHQGDRIEVFAGNEYVSITLQDLLEKKTDEGWLLLAGFDARVIQEKLQACC